jgi:hypothetical protein
VLPADGLYYGHEGETVFSPDNMPEVHVYIGDRELTDMVRVEIREKDRVNAGAARAGVLR